MCVSAQDLLLLYDTLLCPGAPERRKISCRVRSVADGSPGQTNPPDGRINRKPVRSFDTGAVLMHTPSHDRAAVPVSTATLQASPVPPTVWGLPTLLSLSHWSQLKELVRDRVPRQVSPLPPVASPGVASGSAASPAGSKL